MAIVDLRELVNKIQEQKQANVNLTLEFDCTIETDDIKPLVQCINYGMNFVLPYAGENKAEIGLNAAIDYYALTFIVSTTETDFKGVNPQVEEILKQYNTVADVTSEGGKYVQLKYQFNL